LRYDYGGAAVLQMTNIQAADRWRRGSHQSRPTATTNSNKSNAATRFAEVVVENDVRQR
jgi:hypothetical protein